MTILYHLCYTFDFRLSEDLIWSFLPKCYLKRLQSIESKIFRYLKIGFPSYFLHWSFVLFQTNCLIRLLLLNDYLWLVQMWTISFVLLLISFFFFVNCLNSLFSLLRYLKAFQNNQTDFYSSKFIMNSNCIY